MKQFKVIIVVIILTVLLGFTFSPIKNTYKLLASKQKIASNQIVSDIRYSIDDDFNGSSIPDKWKLDAVNNSIKIDNVPNIADKSIKISKTSITNKAIASKSFDGIKGKLFAQVNVRSEEKTGLKKVLNLISSTDKEAICIALKNGNIVEFSNGIETVIAPFSAQKWYNIKIVMDTNTKKYSVFIDGVRYIDNLPLKNSVQDISKVKVGIDINDSGTMYLDNLMIYKNPIQGPTGNIVNVTDYGAKGDGITDDTTAIQNAINACKSGGTVLLKNGTFLCKPIKLKGNMTFYIDTTATIKGSNKIEDYPDVIVGEREVKKSLIYADTTENLIIDGGGTIDGNGGEWRPATGYGYGSEKRRPCAVVLKNCNNAKVRNIYIKDAGMWTFPVINSDNLHIRDVNMNSIFNVNRDGIDVCDCHNVLIENTHLRSDDDTFCLKSSTTRGIDNVIIKHCTAISTAANALKFGTLTVGPITNVLFEDCLVKDTNIGALSVEAVDGSDVSKIKFNRINIQGAAQAFYVIIEDRGNASIPGQPRRIGSINNVEFNNISFSGIKSQSGCYISGFARNNEVHKIKNITFNNCDGVFKGGVTTMPQDPIEYLNIYPESGRHGILPAYGFYLRHVDGVTFKGCDISVNPSDVRPLIDKKTDVSNFLLN